MITDKELNTQIPARLCYRDGELLLLIREDVKERIYEKCKEIYRLFSRLPISVITRGLVVSDLIEWAKSIAVEVNTGEIGIETTLFGVLMYAAESKIAIGKFAYERISTGMTYGGATGGTYGGPSGGTYGGGHTVVRELVEPE
ncbi:hypothetical protein [Natrinema sp. CGMCC1.2065]|uniref:hypothetical protein n=1 Tax=Natrinema sp. CGMCC1.2065 TaxID=3445767 RepID=UPI003F49F2F3